jgi:predicted O-linked N-acetylglucosamine transferase (SPINDLY family)
MIDGFLSAQDFEPHGAQRYYAERLLALPGLGCCYEPPKVTPAAPDLSLLGIRSGVPLLLCPGTPFKYAPAHDRVLVEIARKLEQCQLVFFSDGPDGVAMLLQRRLEQAFERGGLRFSDNAIFVPWQTRERFYGLLGCADLMLDTIGFSGFNTAMQAAECRLPIVTREGRFLRGRFATGILKRMELNDLVASTDEEYVALAVRLARDTQARRKIGAQMRAKFGVLCGDLATIHALEALLSSATLST